MKFCAGEDRNVAAPVIVEILDTPFARAVAILVDRHLAMEGIDRGIDEVITTLKARHLRWVLGCHDFFERSWPSVAHGYLTLRLELMFQSPEPILLLSLPLPAAHALG